MTIDRKRTVVVEVSHNGSPERAIQVSTFGDFASRVDELTGIGFSKSVLKDHWETLQRNSTTVFIAVGTNHKRIDATSE